MNQGLRSRACHLSLLLTLFGASEIAFSHSQSVVEEALFELPLEALLDLEVTVSNRIPTAIRLTPSTVSVFTDKDIRRLRVRTLNELLNYVPSMTVTRSSGEGVSQAISIRGRKSNTLGREVLVLLDGARLNDPVTGGVFSQDRAILLDNIARVEIIRGPGSAIYGANAFSSVIKLESKIDENRLTLTGGEHDYAEAQAAVSHHFEDGYLSLFASHAKDNGEHYEPFLSYFGVSEATRDPFRQSDLNLHAGWHRWAFFARRTERSDAHYVVDGSAFSSRQRHRVENRLARLSWELETDHLSLSSFAEYQENDADSLFALFPENPEPALDGNPFYWSDGSTIEMMGGNFRTVEQERYGLDGVLHTHHDHVINFGILYRKERVGLNPFQSSIDIETLRDKGAIVPSSQPDGIEAGFYLAGERADLLMPSSRESFGIYLQDSWQLRDSVLLTSGLRHDRYQDFGGHSSLRLAGVWQVDQQSSFKLLYGNAYRAPAFIETRAGVATGGISNPDLDPEEVHTFELAWAYSPQSFSSSLTLFANRYKHLIVPVLVSDVVPGFTAFQPQNVGQDESWGVEWEGKFKPAPRMTLTWGASHVIDELENQPVGKRQYFAIAETQWKQLSLSMDAFYHARVASVSTGQNPLPSYWLANMSLGHIVSENLEVSMQVKNLFNRQYATWGPQALLENGLPGRDRAFYLRMEWQLN